jgi:phospholipid/cholesterol/gamma-HCH transport system substrate-binding protein
MTNSELQMELASHYLAKDGYAMTKLDVNYLPNPTRYYMLGLTSRDDYSRMSSTGQAILPQKHESGKSYLSAQIGKRYDNTLVRGGIIESTGGLGVDQYALHDKLKGSLEVYDFGAKNDVRTTKPHARAEVRYQMLKHLNIYGGVDGFLDSKTTNAYVGAGVSFIDDDLKYLLGSSSGALLK